MDTQFKFKRRVEFADTDMAGIMHFANFFRYMEEAEHAFYRSIGMPIHAVDSQESIGWPRVHADCDYKHPARFEDILEILLTVLKVKEKSIHYAFNIQKVEDKKVQEIAIGKIVVVCVSYNESMKKMKAIKIPPEVIARITFSPQSDDYTKN